MTDTGRAPTETQRGALSGGRMSALALLAAISPLATGMILSALPGLRTALGASPVALQLTTTTFLAGTAVGQLLLGALSDRLGRRRPLVAGGVAFVLASIACTIAPTVETLAAARALQGLAGAAGIVLGRAVIADVLEGAAAARAFALLMTIGAIGPAVAPLLGGALLVAGGWRGVFAGLTVIGVAALLAVVRLLPETLPTARRTAGRFGAGLPTAARSLRRRAYLGNTIALVLAYSGLIGYVSGSPFVLQTQYGLTPVQYATVFAANALGLVVGSLVVARIVHRAGSRRLLRIGLMAQLAIAVALLVLALAHALPLPILLALLWLFVTSLSLIAGNATSLALAGLSRNVGTGSAVLGAAQFGVAAAVAPIVGSGGTRPLVAMAAVMVVAATLGTAGCFAFASGRGRHWTAPTRRPSIHSNAADPRRRHRSLE